MDRHGRAVLDWRISNTMNTDQGSRFTGIEWLSAVESQGTAVSMDGKGRRQDNVFGERSWRSAKHEWILLHEDNTLPELQALVAWPCPLSGKFIRPIPQFAA